MIAVEVLYYGVVQRSAMGITLCGQPDVNGSMRGHVVIGRLLNWGNGVKSMGLFLQCLQETDWFVQKLPEMGAAVNNMKEWISTLPTLLYRV